MFSLLGIRWPFWLVCIVLIGAAILLVITGEETGTSVDQPTLEYSRSQVVTPVVEPRQTEGPPDNLAEGRLAETAPSAKDSEVLLQPTDAENRHQAELKVLRDNPQLSPTWKFERAPGNLGAPPKLGTE